MVLFGTALLASLCFNSATVALVCLALPSTWTNNRIWCPVCCVELESNSRIGAPCVVFARCVAFVLESRRSATILVSHSTRCLVEKFGLGGLPVAQWPRDRSRSETVL